jgi:uncharacterized protein involved in tolerance to divalent cations
MILLHILSEDREEIEDISSLLLNHRLITSVNIDWERDRLVLEQGVVVKKKVNLLSGITKALLFQKIDALIRSKFPKNVPEIYSIPIVNIDWDLAHSLIENTEKI